LQSLFRINYFTILSHDRFQEIIDEANKPDSIIRKGVEGHFLSSGCIPLRQAARDTTVSLGASREDSWDVSPWNAVGKTMGGTFLGYESSGPASTGVEKHAL